MSIPLTNYSSQMAQQKKHDGQLTHSNSVKAPHLIFKRSNTTSTMTEAEQNHGESNQLPTTLLPNHSTSLRSLLKTSGLFNRDMESSDNLNEFFASGNEFTLHRLLSDIGGNDINIDMNDPAKFDPTKLFDTRSLSEFLAYDAFDQMNPSTTDTTDSPSNHFDSVPPSAIACSSESFTELCPPTLELTVNEVFHIDASELKMEFEHPSMYTQLDSLDDLAYTPSPSTSVIPQFNFDPHVLAAFEHDYGFLSRPTTIVNTPSPSPTISKRTSARAPRRTSSRLQSRATLMNFNDLLNDNCCASPAISENSSISCRRTKRSHSINRAVDIKTEDDLSYYLERRRKNNEASKISRAARRQKFDDMDSRCAEYERVNTELRSKISTLETVTVNLKNGLIHSFQRKDGASAKF